MNQCRTKGKGWSTANQLKPPVISLLAVPRRLFCFDSLVILDVARLWLFSLYINIKIGKKLFNVRLSGEHLYGKLMFTWLSLVMSVMVSFSAVLFPRDVLEEILNLIEFLRVFLPTYNVPPTTRSYGDGTSV